MDIGTTTVEAVDGSRHERKLTVVAAGYGLCRRVPTYAGDSRLTICVEFNGRWFSEPAAVGTDGALRNRIARIVMRDGIATDDVDILERVARFEREDTAHEAAQQRERERVAAQYRADTEAKRALLALPIKTRRAKVNVALSGDLTGKSPGKMTQEDGYLSSCGTWSIRRLEWNGYWRISHDPSGLAVAPLDRSTLREARAAVAGLVAGGFTDPTTQMEACRTLVFSMRDILRSA